jgi:glycosyltransferase involved in cell wall biosynthesis
MKVCFLAGTLGRGGAEKQLLFMLRALQKAAIETRVLCLTKGESYEREIKDSGVEIEWVGASENKIARLGKITRSLRKRPADIVQSAHFFTNLYAASAGKLLNTKTIGAIRSDLSREILSNGFYGKWQIQLPQHLITNSELARRRAISKGIPEEKVDFVRNVVEAKKNGADGGERDKNKPLNIIFVGRLDENKRPERFVELAHCLRKNLPHLNLNFLVAGDGPLRPRLENQVQKLGLSKKEFSFLGVIEDMSDVYKSADALVLTSKQEGTPNVILEAMAYGVPVLATRVGGIPEILSEKCGILVDPDDQTELHAAAARLISNPDLRSKFVIEGKKYVEENHSIEYLQNKLTEIYSRLIRK